MDLYGVFGGKTCRGLRVIGVNFHIGWKRACVKDLTNIMSVETLTKIVQKNMSKSSNVPQKLHFLGAALQVIITFNENPSSCMDREKNHLILEIATKMFQNAGLVSSWLQRDHNGLPQRAGLSPDQVTTIKHQVQIQIQIQIITQIQIRIQTSPGGGGVRLLVGDARGPAQH